jgi:hypothetical protein
MSEFSCSNCDYVSGLKTNVNSHINNKNKCWDIKIPQILEISIEIRCKYCEKEYKTKPSLKRHHKICKEKDNKLLELNVQIKELKIRLEERGDNITNNITNNNLIINVYGKPEIDYLSDQDFANLFMEGSKANAHLAKRIWMDPKHPENHSILINNVSRNTAKAYTRPYNSERENPIELLDQPRIFNKMYDTCKMHFEIKSNDWEEEYHTWPESDQKKYTKLKPKIDKYHASNEDPESNRKFNRDVKNLLIDNRDMIKKTLTNIK